MKDQSKTKRATIQELAALRQRIEELEQSESEWQKEKNALKISEARFRSYFDLSLYGIAITSPEKGWIQVNDRICSIMGYSRDEIVRKTWPEMTYPDDLAADLEQFNRVLSGQIDQYNIEKRFVQKNGNVVWTNLSVGCVRRRDGSVDHIVAMVEDITSGKLAEETLRESEDRYRSLFENSIDAVLLTGLDGGILAANPEACRIFGSSEEEICRIGRAGLMAMTGARLTAALDEWARTGQFRGELDFVRKDGTSFPGEISSAIFKDRDGNLKTSIIVRDITDRKRVEQSLRESEELYRSLFQNMLNGFAYCKMLYEKGNPQDFIYLHVNDAFESLTGLKDVVGKKVSEVIPGIREADAELFEIYGRVAVTGKPEKFEKYVEALKMWFSISAYSPHKEHFVAVFDVITERKLAEEDLRLYRERLEELVKQRTLELQERNAELVKEIAERRRAEKAIRDSEERFRILVDLAPDIIYRIKEDGTIDFISTAVQQLGYHPEKLIGMPFEEIVHPADRQKVRDILVEKRIGGRRAKNIEIRLLNSGQGDQDYMLSHSFVELSARGYWDVADIDIARPDKHFLYTLGIAHDITARKRAEEALKGSSIRTHLLKNVASAANAAATPDDALRVAIEGIARYIGWPVGHVYMVDDNNPEMPIPTDIWYFEDENRFHLFREVTAKTVFTPGAGMIGRVLASKKNLWIEDVTVFPDFLRTKVAKIIGIHGAFGFPVIVDGKVNAILEFFSLQAEKSSPSLMDLMDEIGLQLGIVIERKQVEDELKKLSRAVEQSPATVVITDVKGKIQYVNPKFAELTGYSSVEAIGKNPRILNSGIQPKSIYKELWETILSGQNWYGTFCNRKKDGKIYWERASISPVRNEHGEIKNFVAVKEDITKLLQYEDELKKATEIAENANRAKSDFLASMSHELRTPLNAIIGFSEVLKEQFFGPLIEKQAEYVDDILESGKHLLSLINDILDLSKVEAGKMELELSRVNISDLINNSLIMIKEKTMKHHITLNNDVRQEVEDLNIMADARKLKQVLFNLLSNAAKFTPDGGVIRLEAKLAHGYPIMDHDQKEVTSGLSVMNDAFNLDFLEISVEDTGIGIIPEHQENIFEPFYQVKGFKQDKTPGTGLGLPLSKDLVELHGGTMWVESAGEGKGSKFSFKIPIQGGEKLEKAIDSY